MSFTRALFTALVAVIVIVVLSFSFVLANKADDLELKSKSLQQQVVKLKSEGSALVETNRELKQDNVKLKRQVTFYKAAYEVNYQMVMNELVSLRDRYQANQEIPFSDVKSVVIDVQHVYSVLTFEQSNKLGKVFSDLFYGTKIMDAYEPEQADQVWQAIGDIQWCEETN